MHRGRRVEKTVGSEESPPGTRVLGNSCAGLYSHGYWHVRLLPGRWASGHYGMAVHSAKSADPAAMTGSNIPAAAMGLGALIALSFFGILSLGRTDKCWTAAHKGEKVGSKPIW